MDGEIKINCVIIFLWLREEDGSIIIMVGLRMFFMIREVFEMLEWKIN